MKYKNIVILGLKHSGKSTLGKRMASKFGYDFFDTDDLIEKKAKMSVRELYNSQGSQAFSLMEEQVCAELAQTTFKDGNNIIATGGGICDNEPALMNLRAADAFVFLKNDLNISVNRIVRKIKTDENGEFTGVPAFIKAKNPKTLEEIRTLLLEKFTERAARYTAASDIVVELGDAPIEDNLEILINAVNQ